MENKNNSRFMRILHGPFLCEETQRRFMWVGNPQRDPAMQLPPHLKQRVLRDTQSSAGLQEVGDVLHLFKGHPRLVHLPH